MEKYSSIQQLMKKEEGEEKVPLFPPTVIQAVFDAKTGASLESILAQYNNLYVQDQGSVKDTRLIIPMQMRRAGLTITYTNMDSETITERASSAVQKDNDHWALDTNWTRVDELSLSGEIAVSTQGTWIINGEDTGIKAVGPKGDAGLTPWLKTIGNRLHFSYDNTTWEPCSDPIAAYFRWNSNKIQISRDNKTWTDLSGEFADNLRIKGYVATYANLPSSAAQGDIYGVGPTYAEEDTEKLNPIYRFYVRNANTWVDNGSFTSFTAGIVQETGDSENAVMSQKAVTDKLTELGSEVNTISQNFVVTNEKNIEARASKSFAIKPSKGDVYVFEITDIVNTQAVVTLANAASPFNAATLKTIATISENGSFIYKIEDEFLETAKYIVFSHISNTISVVSYNASLSIRLPHNRALQNLSDSLNKKIDDLGSDLNLQISSLAESQNIVEEKEYIAENPAYGTKFNSARIIYDKRWEWENGDFIKSVIIPSGNETATPSFLKIYNSEKVLKKDINLGILPANTNNVIDVSSYGLKLEKGDIVAIKGCWYRANVGETNFYDLATEEEVTNYTYGIGFVFLHIKSTIKEAIKNLTTHTSVRILCFGNSFSQDSMSYVPVILKHICPNLNVSLGIAVKGACSLAQHLANFTNENQTLNGTIIEPSQYSYQYWNGTAWTSSGSKDVDDILHLEEWDIITFQQNGGAAYKDWDIYFSPFIYKLHKALFNKLNKAVKIGWLLTHGSYAGNDDEFLNHWEGTAINAKKIMENTGTGILFTYGTAVQNLRTTNLVRLGDGEGQNLCADSVHLQEGIGCLVAAYSNALTILDCVGMKHKGVIGDQTRIDAEFISRINVLGQNTGESGVIGITEENCFLAQIAAELGVKKPYEVTDMSGM